MSCCSFCGEIEEIPFINVDNFNNTHKSAYFLSHYHSDHYDGLHTKDLSNWLKKNTSYIYASEVTLALMKNDTRLNKNVIPYLKALKLGRNTVTIKHENEEIYLKVITLPAGHSLGSVMFLFEHNDRTILFTGDFRITANDCARYTHLNKNGGPIPIDVMYIDTTFQDKPILPRRSDTIRNVVARTQEWLDLSQENTVCLETPARYGYERICNDIFAATNIKTYMESSRWRKQEVFTEFSKELPGITDDPSSRVHMRYHKSSQPLPMLAKNTLFIYLTAMRWTNSDVDENFIEEDKDIKEGKRIKVCFSTHCGRDELVSFINYFLPKKIVGFPKPFVRDTIVKLEAPVSPLKFKISSSLKRLKEKTDSDSPGQKISKSVVKDLFDW